MDYNRDKDLGEAVLTGFIMLIIGTVIIAGLLGYSAYRDKSINWTAGKLERTEANE